MVKTLSDLVDRLLDSVAANVDPAHQEQTVALPSPTKDVNVEGLVKEKDLLLKLG